MLGIKGCEIVLQRKLRAMDNRATGHPGSKKPRAKHHREGQPGVRHNRGLNDFNEKCYERGILHAVRRDYR